eukprot:gene20455-22471_t
MADDGNIDAEEEPRESQSLVHKDSELAMDEAKEVKKIDLPTSSKTAPAKKNADDVCNNMLDKVMSYLQGELTVTCEDYKLLETLNNLTIAKYKDMSDKTKEVTGNLESINEKYMALQPYLQQIDQLEDGVQKLETAAYKLDAYSKQLELKFKKMQK